MWPEPSRIPEGRHATVVAVRKGPAAASILCLLAVVGAPVAAEQVGGRRPPAPGSLSDLRLSGIVEFSNPHEAEVSRSVGANGERGLP